jgi:hypothetical protein
MNYFSWTEWHLFINLISFSIYFNYFLDKNALFGEVFDYAAEEAIVVTHARFRK